MFAKVSKRASGVAVQIAESYRNADGKPRHRTVRHMGTANLNGPKHLKELMRVAEAICVQARHQDKPALFPDQVFVDLAIKPRPARRQAARRIPCRDMRRLRAGRSLAIGFHEVFGTLFA